MACIHVDVNGEISHVEGSVKLGIPRRTPRVRVSSFQVLNALMPGVEAHGADVLLPVVLQHVYGLNNVDIRKLQNVVSDFFASQRFRNVLQNSHCAAMRRIGV